MADSYIFEQIIRMIHTEIRRVSRQGKVLWVYGKTPASQDPFQTDKGFLDMILNREVKPGPDIFCEYGFIYYGIIVLNNGDKILIGPVRVSHSLGDRLKRWHEEHRITDNRSLKLPYCDFRLFADGVSLLYYLVTGNPVYYQDLLEMNGLTEPQLAVLEREVHEVTLTHQEKEIPHNPYDHEERKLDSIRRGDLDELRNCQKEVWTGEIGKVGGNPVRQAKNIGIIVIVLASRAAIRGGLSPETAFSMADGFILGIENMNDIMQIEAATARSEVEFASSVKSLKVRVDTNILVEKAKDYILKHLHSPVRVRDISVCLGVNKDYLSDLFSREEGITIQNYICGERIRQSEFLLKYSDYDVGEIANYLMFSTQSHFGQAFKRRIGMTPGQYRKKYGKKQYE